MNRVGPSPVEHLDSESTELEIGGAVVEWDGGGVRGGEDRGTILLGRDAQAPRQEARSPMSTAAVWDPSRIVRVVEAFPTGSSVVRVETEQGEGFLKALSNKTEPHNLAAELVGTLLARRMKLPTLDFHIIALTAADRIRLADGSYAHAGPAFITRFEDGIAWSGAVEDLDKLVNPADVGRLIVLDTWTRNCDRYMPRDNDRPRMNRDNVYLSRREAPKGQFVLKAIDQGCCFTCGRDLTPRLSNLDCVQEMKLYGRFPQFVGRMDRKAMLEIVQEVEAVTRQEVEGIVQQVPSGWDLSSGVRQALCDFICQRAKYIRAIIDQEWPPQTLFDVGTGQEPQE